MSRSIEGEAREVGASFASLVANEAVRGTSAHPRCLLAGGETTVTVAGAGIGGRNSEAALAAAIALSGAEGVAIGFLATDGDDGVTGAAGAIVDGTTVPAHMLQPRSRRCAPTTRSRSSSAWARRGHPVRPEPTSTIW